MTTVRKGAIATICNASTASVCNEAVQVEGLWIPVRERRWESDCLGLFDYDFAAIITAHTAYSVVNVP